MFIDFPLIRIDSNVKIHHVMYKIVLICVFHLAVNLMSEIANRRVNFDDKTFFRWTSLGFKEPNPSLTQVQASGIKSKKSFQLNI